MKKPEYLNTFTEGHPSPPCGEGQGMRHISFDLWMTLVRSHPEYKKKRAELFCHFFSIENLDLVEKAIRKTDLMANHINETTGGNIDALELYMMVLHQVHDHWKTVTMAELLQFYKATETLFEVYPFVPMDETVEPALQMLRRKSITMNILSNTGFIKGYMLQNALQQMGFSRYFSFSIFSDETGHSKPNKLMFTEVWNGVNNLGGKIEKYEVLHFGDNPFADVDGAKNFEFRGALFEAGKGTFYQQIESAINR